jgi:hypothetical protein
LAHTERPLWLKSVVSIPPQRRCHIDYYDSRIPNDVYEHDMYAQLEPTAPGISLTPRGLSRTLIVGLLLALAWADSRRTFAQDVPEQDKPRGPALIQRGSGRLVLMSRSDVREDLELTDAQTKAVNKLRDAVPLRLRDMGLGTDEISAKEKRQRIAQFDEQLGADLASILLPSQLKRLRQIEIQLRVQAANVSDEFVNDEILKTLHVTDDQRQQWNSIRQEVDREYDRQRIAIREQAQARFLAELTPEQRAQWKELFGAPFLAKEKPASPRNVPAKKSAP